MNAALSLDALYPVALKRCRECGEEHPIEMFRIRNKGSQRYRVSYCDPCRKKIRREREAGVRPGEDRRHLPPRNEHEKACDEALWEFRMAGAAFQGCRV